MKNNDILLLENIIKQVLFEQVEVRPLEYDKMSSTLQSNFDAWAKTQKGYNDQRLSATYYDDNVEKYATRWWNQLKPELKKLVSGKTDMSQEEQEKRKKEIEDAGMTEQEVLNIEMNRNYKPGSYDVKTDGGVCQLDYVKENPDDPASPCVNPYVNFFYDRGLYLIYAVVGVYILQKLGFNVKNMLVKSLSALGKVSKNTLNYFVAKNGATRLDRSKSSMSNMFIQIDNLFAKLESQMISKFGPDSPKVYASKKQIKILIQEMKALMKSPAIRKALESDFRAYMKGLVLDGKITKELWAKQMGTKYLNTTDARSIVAIMRSKEKRNPEFYKNALSELPKPSALKTDVELMSQYVK